MASDQGFLTKFQWILVGLLTLACINYLTLVITSHSLSTEAAPIPTTEEGFESGSNSESSLDKNGLYSWKTDPLEIYDAFYAKIYDQLTQGEARTKGKVALCISTWKKYNPNISEWTVLDAGCGTGIASLAFAKMDVGRVIGIDSSPSMLRTAKELEGKNQELTTKQKTALEWRQDNVLNPSACTPGEVSHTVVFYFTLYYLRDMEQFFRHLNIWTKPGGFLAVEVVNKYKFDPIIDAANPFVAFSMQKYSKERLRKSKVAFDKFDYEAEFVLHDPQAEFRETFRFKDGNIRRQKHEFFMPSVEKIVKDATIAGWTYNGFQDLTSVAFEYGYLLQFTKS